MVSRWERQPLWERSQPKGEAESRGQICLGLWLQGVGSGFYKKLKGDPHSQEEWQVRTRTWLNQEKGFDVFCLVVWLIGLVWFHFYFSVMAINSRALCVNVRPSNTGVHLYSLALILHASRKYDQAA